MESNASGKSLQAPPKVRRNRLQKKRSALKISAADLSGTTLDRASSDQKRHSAQLLPIEQQQNRRVEIVSSMSTAGIPRPAQLPAVYQNDAKLMSMTATGLVASQHVRAMSLQNTTSPKPPTSPENAGNGLRRTPLPPLDYCIKRTSLRLPPDTPVARPLSVRWNSSLSVQIPDSGATDKPVPEPQAHRAASMSAITQRPVTSLKRGGSVRFEPLPEEDSDTASNSPSSASSCYSRTSSISSDLGHVSQFIRPVPPPATYADLVMDPVSAELSSEDSFLELSSTPRTQSKDNLTKISTGKLHATDEHMAGNETDSSLDRACEQLESQLQVFSERISHRQQQDPITPSTPQHQRKSQQKHGHSSSSSSNSSIMSASEGSASTVATPMTEVSPSSYATSPIKAAKLKRSSSLLYLLDEVTPQAEEKKMIEPETEVNVAIDSSDASKLVYHILAALPDLTSLFSAALISRGFYVVFKAHELNLVRLAIKKMSPALYDLCELSHARDHFLTADDHLSLTPSSTATTSYLRGYDHAMYTIVALKVLIADRCRHALRPDQISHFQSEANEERSARIDAAIWRIWAFCSSFGSDSGRQQDLFAQKAWLDGKMKSAGHESLSRSELEDILEVWTALLALLESLHIEVADACAVGLIDESITSPQSQKLMLQDWSYHVMSLGPRAVLDLASTWPSTSAAIMRKARSRGWTECKLSSEDGGMSTFLHEAATRLHVARVLAETRNMPFALPSRAAGRPVMHRKVKSEPQPRQAAADLIFPTRGLPQSTEQSSHSVHPKRRYGILGSPTMPPASMSTPDTDKGQSLRTGSLQSTVRRPQVVDSQRPLSSARMPAPETSAAQHPNDRRWDVVLDSSERPAMLVSNHQVVNTHQRSQSMRSFRTVHRLGSLDSSTIHPAMRAGSISSSTSDKEPTSPLVEYGEARFALPYSQTKPSKLSSILPHRRRPAPIQEQEERPKSSIERARTVTLTIPTQKPQMTVRQMWKGGFFPLAPVGVGNCG